LNIKEVANKVGVSITTVSRVLNSPEKVNEETKKKVLDTMEELNYTPNWFARNIQNKRTNIIGIIVPDTLQQSNMAVANGVEKIVLQKNCNIILCTSGFDREAELNHINTLVERKIDGLILVSSMLRKENLAMLKKKEVPFVLVEKTEDSEDENVIYTNYDSATFEAVDYLAEMGRKKIAIILTNDKCYANREKLKGYKSAIKENNLELREDWMMEAKNTLEGGFAATNKLINHEDVPDAIFACTDTMAFGAIEAMKQNGLTPDDLGIIGFEGLEVGAVVEPKLTSVTIPAYRMGLTAGRMLFDLIEEEDASGGIAQAIMMQSRLKIRKSCGNKERLREIW